MKALIIYKTTVRVNNNSYTNFYHRLSRKTVSSSTYEVVTDSTYSGIRTEHHMLKVQAQVYLS